MQADKENSANIILHPHLNLPSPLKPRQSTPQPSRKDDEVHNLREENKALHAEIALLKERLKEQEQRSDQQEQEYLRRMLAWEPNRVRRITYLSLQNGELKKQLEEANLHAHSSTHNTSTVHVPSRQVPQPHAPSKVAGPPLLPFEDNFHPGEC